MGVADGVYMWKELGIDSGYLSRTIMETAMHIVQAGYEDVLKGRQHAVTALHSPVCIPGRLDQHTAPYSCLTCCPDAIDVA